MYCFPACKKDPSAALGMTKREDGLSYISLHPAAGVNIRPLLPPSRGRREKSKILPEGKVNETRIPLPYTQSLPLEGKVPQRGG